MYCGEAISATVKVGVVMIVTTSHGNSHTWQGNEGAAVVAAVLIIKETVAALFVIWEHEPW